MPLFTNRIGRIFGYLKKFNKEIKVSTTKTNSKRPDVLASVKTNDILPWQHRHSRDHVTDPLSLLTSSPRLFLAFVRIFPAFSWFFKRNNESVPRRHRHSSGNAKVTWEEIKNAFMVTRKYGDSGGWPRETIMLCRVTSPERNQAVPLLEQVYRNTLSQQHAETFFFNDEKAKEIVHLVKGQAGRKVTVDVIINYSPCHACVHKIKQFVRRVRNAEIDIEIKILFANFYIITPYAPRNEAPKNQKGLYLLMQLTGVELKPFQDRNDWERFLDSNLVNITVEQRKEFLTNLYPNSSGRKERETIDKEYLSMIRQNFRIIPADSLQKLENQIKDLGL